MQGSIIRVQTRRVTVQAATPCDAVRECRICLSGEQDDNRLVSPCGCTGSVEFVHTKCFHAWIRKKAEDPLQREQILASQGLNCEICHERYRFSYELVTKIANCQVFRRKLQSRKFLAAATLLFILIDLALLAVMLGYAVTDQQSPTYDIRQPRFFLVYVALAFALLSTGYGFSEFGKLFLVYQSFELVAGEGGAEKGRVRVVRGCSSETTNFNEAMQESHMRVQNSGHLVQYI